MAVHFDSCRWMCERFALVVVCLFPLACNRWGGTATAPARKTMAPPTVTTAATSGSPRKADSDWPSFLGPLGTGVSPETGIFTRWATEGLRVRWQVPLGGGYGPPAVADGRVFLAERHGNEGRV